MTAILFKPLSYGNDGKLREVGTTDGIEVGPLETHGHLSIARIGVNKSHVVEPEDVIIEVTDTTDTRTITLPSAATLPGRFLVIKDSSGGAGTKNITVLPDGSDLIDGSSSFVISLAYGAVILTSTGTGWTILSRIAAGGSEGGGASIALIPLGGDATSEISSNTVVCRLGFNPADWAVSGKTTTFTFRTVGRNAASGTGSVELYDLTSSSSLKTLSFSTTSVEELSSAFVPANARHLLELRIRISGGGGPGSGDYVEASSLIEVTWS